VFKCTLSKLKTEDDPASPGLVPVTMSSGEGRPGLAPGETLASPSLPC
jgi:hypothetical protein